MPIKWPGDVWNVMPARNATSQSRGDACHLPVQPIPDMLKDLWTSRSQQQTAIQSVANLSSWPLGQVLKFIILHGPRSHLKPAAGIPSTPEQSVVVKLPSLLRTDSVKADNQPRHTELHKASVQTGHSAVAAAAAGVCCASV